MNNVGDKERDQRNDQWQTNRDVISPNPPNRTQIAKAVTGVYLR